MNAKPQRVLHYYARYLEHPSGVTDSLNNWAEASLRAGDDVQILAANPSGEDRNEFALTAITKPIAHLGHSRGTWIPTGLFRELRKNDLLILHEGWVLSNVVAVLAARVRRAQVVVIPHGVYEEQIVLHQRDIVGVRSALERWVLRKAAAVHVFYPGECDVVQAFEPRVMEFIVVPNGASDPGADASWRGTGDYFLWMGRFDVFHKGLDNLLEFWAKLPEPVPRLLLVGPNFMDGREKIAELVERYGLTKSVELRGRVSGKEKVQLLAECRAYLHPSRWESCSIMLLEALAAGVPSLISSSIHAAHELGPIDVLRSTAFTSEAAVGGIALSGVDRNADLGNRASNWANTNGSWSEMGAYMVREQTERGLRIGGGPVV